MKYDRVMMLNLNCLRY